MLRRALATAMLLSAPLLTGAASLFPDVPASHLYAEDIELLVRAGVIHGNPDGTFRPERTVNRAEMLKMLYLASERTPDGTQTGCFPDVERGAWYEMYVCDAAKHGFVHGYADGLFRPGQTVNRVEALKMLFTVFGVQVTEDRALDPSISYLSDIERTAWYARYIGAAYKKGVLPVAGRSGASFGPGADLERGEAAAYIASAHALGLHKEWTANERPKPVETETDADIRPVDYPFEQAGEFSRREPVSYRFALSAERTVMKIDAETTGSDMSGLSCRLYLLRDDGFSEEYYLGTEEGRSCVLLVALRPGEYQLQLNPKQEGSSFMVRAEAAQGDGNDGFMEAAELLPNRPRTSSITTDDYYDWYTFTILNEVNAVFEVTSTRAVRCIIYSPLEIDLFGFEGPACNTPYRFKPGTYTVGIGRMPPLGKAQDYTIILRMPH